MDWGSTFELTLPVAELVIRGSAVFLAVFVLMRVVGQREAGGLGVTDVLVIVLAAEATAPGLYGDAGSVGDSLVVVTSILSWSVAIDALSYHWPWLGRFLKSRPKVLIADGRLNHRALRREFMTTDELESLLRLEGVEDIATVKRAQIEPNGMVSVLRTDGVEAEAPEHRPEL